MAVTWCPDCRAFMLNGICTECRRRKAWGTILGGLAAMNSLAQDVGATVHLDDCLAAAAFLMQDRQALLHQHRRELRDEAREASRASGEAYDQGRDEGRREGRGDW